MEQPVWFVPGRPTPPEGVLARYRSPQPVGVAMEYVRRLTGPGDVVLHLFCQGPLFLREAVCAGRRAVGVNINPVSLLVAGLGLEGLPDPTVLKAAFTRLADSRKGAATLHLHIEGLYRSRCPVCGAEGIAEWFAWDREAGYPYAKRVRCPRCAKAQEGAADEEDIAGGRRFEPRGLPYHYALNRVAPLGHPARERAAELVALYTPRNLSALVDVLLRLEGMELERSVRAVMQGLLLEAFDRGSGLDPYGEERTRPRLLRLPARFLERNVWLLLEEGLDRLIGQAREEPVRRAANLSALLADRTPAYVLVPCAARDVGRLLPVRSVSLILADPPRPDGVFWALCALWSGWLWDSPPAHALRPFLRRRRFDWDWHQRALRTALTAAASLLTPEGHLVVLTPELEEEMVASAFLAGVGAGYELEGWGGCPEVGCRTVWQVRKWRREGPTEQGTAPEPEEVAAEAAGFAPSLAETCLRERAEPTPWPFLQSAVYAGLAAKGWSAPTVAPVVEGVRRGMEGMGLERVDEGQDLWWLPTLKAERLADPLADRVEEWVCQAFLSRPLWSKEELALAVYAAFHGSLTPSLSLVLLCLDSYGVAGEKGWRLREEDAASWREEEIKALRRELQALGARLGFQTRSGRGWDVRWQEQGRDAYVFVVLPTAAVGRHLLAGPAVPGGARPCLVFPGGRAELLAYKIRRDPRLARVAEEQGWQFIKFRHLRRLITERLDRRLFETVLGLDPIVEREGVQIPLVMEG